MSKRPATLKWARTVRSIIPEWWITGMILGVIGLFAFMDLTSRFPRFAFRPLPLILLICVGCGVLLGLLMFFRMFLLSYAERLEEEATESEWQELD